MSEGTIRRMCELIQKLYENAIVVVMHAGILIKPFEIDLANHPECRQRRDRTQYWPKMHHRIYAFPMEPAHAEEVSPRNFSGPAL